MLTQFPAPAVLSTDWDSSRHSSCQPHSHHPVPCGWCDIIRSVNSPWPYVQVTLFEVNTQVSVPLTTGIEGQQTWPVQVNTSYNQRGFESYVRVRSQLACRTRIGASSDQLLISSLPYDALQTGSAEVKYPRTADDQWVRHSIFSLGDQTALRGNRKCLQISQHKASPHNVKTLTWGWQVSVRKTLYFSSRINVISNGRKNKSSHAGLNKWIANTRRQLCNRGSGTSESGVILLPHSALMVEPWLSARDRSVQ